MRSEARRGDQADAHSHGHGCGTHGAKHSRLRRRRTALHRRRHDWPVARFVPDEAVPQRCVVGETAGDPRATSAGHALRRRELGTCRRCCPHHGGNGDGMNRRRKPERRYAARPRHHASRGQLSHRRTMRRRADVHTPRKIVRDADEQSAQYLHRGPSSPRRARIVFGFPQVRIDLRQACRSLGSRQTVRVDARPRAHQPRGRGQRFLSPPGDGPPRRHGAVAGDVDWVSLDRHPQARRH